MKSNFGTTIKRIGKIIVYILLIISVYISIVSCIDKIENQLNSQFKNTLDDVAEKTAELLEASITGRYNLLYGIVNEIELKGTDEVQTIIDKLKPFVDVYGAKRLGYIDANMVGYTTDGHTQQFWEEPHITNALEGKQDISVVLKDMIGDEGGDINVFTVPVSDPATREVVGLVFATFDTDKFKELVTVKSFGGQARSLITKSNGVIISGSHDFDTEGITDIFDIVLADGNLSAEDKLRVQMDMGMGRKGTVKVNYAGEDLYVQYEPVDIEIASGKWYMFDLVPARILEDRVANVWYHIQRLGVIIVAIAAAGFLFYFSSYIRQRRELLKLAYKDPITGGYNQAHFMEQLRRYRVVTGYLISADLMEFRIVNNICGAQMGDKMIAETWKIINSKIKYGEYAGHVNADKFIFYITYRQKEEVISLLSEMTRELRDKQAELGLPKLMPYFGVYCYKGDESLESAIGRANHARHYIKGRKDVNFSFYDEIIEEDRIENKRLEDMFEEAIKSDTAFEVWYQPKFDARETRIVGAEALVRWREADGNLIPPGRFIPLFEKNGNISKLDEYVFKKVCATIRRWIDEERTIYPISINISRASLFYKDIVKRYKEILDSYGVPARYVQIEITESATIGMEDIKSLMAQFHEAGFKLLLDDFGTGYSSLSTLNELDFDTLKLDKRLIDYIGDRNGEILLFHTIELARHFGLSITAEGVEKGEQVDFLRMMQCDDIQGFYFAKPYPLNEFEEYLKVS